MTRAHRGEANCRTPGPSPPQGWSTTWTRQSQCLAGCLEPSKGGSGRLRSVFLQVERVKGISKHRQDQKTSASTPCSPGGEPSSSPRPEHTTERWLPGSKVWAFLLELPSGPFLPAFFLRFGTQREFVIINEACFLPFIT